MCTKKVQAKIHARTHTILTSLSDASESRKSAIFLLKDTINE